MSHRVNQRQNTIEIKPAGPLAATIRPPGSKSLTNRALVCAALARGTSTLEGVLDSEDTRLMIDALGSLGIKLAVDHNEHVARVVGCGGRPPAAQADIYVGNSGTTARFLTALLTLGQGKFRLHGSPRMHERPIADLAAALAQLGATVDCEGAGGCPPVVVTASGLAGGKTSLFGDVSSQFLSGLLMAAPYSRRGVEIAIDGPLVSQPYVRMTLAVMRAFGVDVPEVANDLRHFRIPASAGYTARTYAIEPDASAASYFWAAAAIAGGSVTVLGLSAASLQGDTRLVDLLEQMGCRVERGADSITVHGGELRGVTVDMNDISDTVQTLAVAALFAHGPTTVTGVAHIRHKETDRIAALATELRKVGATVVEREDGLTIMPGTLHGAEIDTYDDHRMAMSMSLVGLRVPGIVIRDPGCTAKTYPRYFDDLAAVCAQRG